MRVGVAGVGHLGFHHARILRDLSDEVRIFDTDAERAGTVSETLGTGVADSLADLLAWCDALVVACSTSSHYRVVMEAIAAGRHALVEKPIASDSMQGDEMALAAETSRLVLAVGHSERFNPAVVAASGLLGSPLFVEGHRLAPFKPRGTDVSVVMDLMIHDIDLILSFMKSPVTNIAASGVAVLTDKIDIASARITFENGAVANMTASRISREPLRKLRFFQEKLYVSIDFASRTVEAFEVKGESILPVEVKVAESDPLTAELTDFLECCRTGARPVIGAFEGVRALRTAELIVSGMNRPGKA